MIGSFKSIGRKRGRACALTMTPASPGEEIAEDVPLPSSPIDIPSTAPALELDLGPAAFESTSLTGVDNLLQERDNTVLCDSGIAELPETTLDLRRDSIQQRPTDFTSPEHLMQTTKEPSVFDPHVPPSLSPLGAMLALENDRSRHEGDLKEMRLFERSVSRESPQYKRALRAIHSLDAVTEACADANAMDGVCEDCSRDIILDIGGQTSPRSPSIESTESVDCPFKLVVDPSSPGKPNNIYPKSNASTSTIHSLPLSLPELTRQPRRSADPKIVQQDGPSPDILYDSFGGPDSTPHPAGTPIVHPLRLMTKDVLAQESAGAPGQLINDSSLDNSALGAFNLED